MTYMKAHLLTGKMILKVLLKYRLSSKRIRLSPSSTLRRRRSKSFHSTSVSISLAISTWSSILGCFHISQLSKQKWDSTILYCNKLRPSAARLITTIRLTVHNTSSESYLIHSLGLTIVQGDKNSSVAWNTKSSISCGKTSSTSNSTIRTLVNSLDMAISSRLRSITISRKRHDGSLSSSMVIMKIQLWKGVRRMK